MRAKKKEEETEGGRKGERWGGSEREEGIGKKGTEGGKEENKSESEVSFPGMDVSVHL